MAAAARRRVRGGVQSTTTINARGKSSGDVRGSYSICFCILKYTAGLSNSIQWQRPVDITLVFASLITWFSHKYYAMVDSKQGQCISHLILHTKYVHEWCKQVSSIVVLLCMLLYSGFYRNAGNNCLLWWALWSIPTNLIGKIAWFINAVDTIHGGHCKIASIIDKIRNKLMGVIVNKTY